MRLTDQGMLGFAEINPGRAGFMLLWNSQGTLAQLTDNLSDLDDIGGTPWEEYVWEDGTEAPVRPTRRSSTNEWVPDRDPTTVPSEQLLEAWSNAGTATAVQRVLQEAQVAELLERERQRLIDEQQRAEKENRKRYARIKGQVTKARRDRELAALRSRLRN